MRYVLVVDDTPESIEGALFVLGGMGFGGEQISVERKAYVIGRKPGGTEPLRIPSASTSPSASPSPAPPLPLPGEVDPLAEARILAYASTRFGLPVTGAYTWGGYTFCQYRGGAGTESEGRCVICDSPRGVYVVKSGFAQKYFEPGKVEQLGAPTGEEHSEQGWPAYQNFERGHMTWRADTGVIVWT